MDRAVPRVAAVVLTFNNRESLSRCLAAIAAQTCVPETLIVVDNASDERVDDLVARFPGASLLRLPENAGPAGGYAAGLRAFATSGSEWAWLLDDDCVPSPTTLETQLAAARAGSDAVLATMIDRATGEVTNTQGWCAVLIGRPVVETVGVPDAELFWWTEDTEYLQWRIPRAGFRVARSDEATVEVNRSRPDASKPAWKYYYEARNQVHYRLHTQHVDDRPLPRHLTVRVRAWRAIRAVGKLAARAITRERRERGRKLAMVFRGTYDGLRGRLGRTVPAEGSHRPLVPRTGCG